jgi:hypothetical protein
VNAIQLLDIIQKADRLGKADLLQLKKVQENFPYFQIPHVLVARYDFLQDGVAESKTLGQAAVTSPDRIWLKTLIEKPRSVDLTALPDEEVILPRDSDASDDPLAATDSLKNLEQPLPVSNNAKEDSSEKTKLRRRRSSHDDLIETIKRKEKKTIVDEKTKEQIDLIKAFSKKDIKLATIKEIEANQNTENLAESSTKLHDNLLSESFAKILANQGKKVMAREIYGKLILKFPEKRAYFADLIEKLKE